jgi:hypothetical protein
LLALLTLPAVARAAPSLREVLEHQIRAIEEAMREPRGREASLLRLFRANGVAREADRDLRFVLALEHGFRDWAHAMEHGEDRIDPRFEAAVDAIVAGDLAALEARLAEDSALVRAHSTYGHRATLLHYVAANGVETTRQYSSPNTPALARVLLRAGAEPDAQSASYDGTCITTLALLVSSDHPAKAGVQADLVEELCRGGANPNGPEDDGAPLWMAITSGYTAAAERLARSGARVDNLIGAAAIGDLERVSGYFGPDRRLLPSGPLRGVRAFTRGRPFDAEHLLEYALIYAARHGRCDVVAFLLSKDPDLGIREPVYGATAAGMARYRHPAAGRPDGSPDVSALLEATARSPTRAR